MNMLDRLHMIHRFWRYRLRTEPESIRFVLRQNLTDTTVLDIGANKGIYSYWLSKQVGPAGRVIAFEPQPELGGFLADVKDTFRLDNVTIVNKGVSDHSGETLLFRSSPGSPRASMTGEASDPTAITVPVVSLDDYFKDQDVASLSFIKADVEEHELNVFKGAEKLLREQHPTLLFECHHDTATRGELFSYLTNLDYGGFFMVKDREIPVAEFDRYPYRNPGEHHRNYIFRFIP